MRREAHVYWISCGEGGIVSFRVASAKASSLGTAFGILREQLVASAALIALNVRKLALAYAATSRFGLVVEPELLRPHTPSTK